MIFMIFRRNREPKAKILRLDKKCKLFFKFRISPSEERIPYSHTFCRTARLADEIGFDGIDKLS